MNRAGIPKSVRFAVFARDGFACRYCGRKSDEVKLVLDHVIAVAKGGGNGEENLATACEDCNSGKGVSAASPNPDDETVRLSRLQAHREQEEVARAAIETVAAKKRFRQIIINTWCDLTGRNYADPDTIATVVKYAEIHGFDVVLGWMEKAAVKAGRNDRQMGRYISGIRRCVLKEEAE